VLEVELGVLWCSSGYRGQSREEECRGSHCDFAERQ
jgi:hypothetical protein